MLKMNIRQLLGVVAFLTFFSGGAMTQNLSVSYKRQIIILFIRNKFWQVPGL